LLQPFAARDISWQLGGNIDDTRTMFTRRDARVAPRPASKLESRSRCLPTPLGEENPFRDERHGDCRTAVPPARLADAERSFCGPCEKLARRTKPSMTFGLRGGRGRGTNVTGRFTGTGPAKVEESAWRRSPSFFTSARSCAVEIRAGRPSANEPFRQSCTTPMHAVIAGPDRRAHKSFGINFIVAAAQRAERPREDAGVPGERGKLLTMDPRAGKRAVRATQSAELLLMGYACPPRAAFRKHEAQQLAGGRISKTATSVRSSRRNIPAMVSETRSRLRTLSAAQPFFSICSRKLFESDCCSCRQRFPR